MGWVESAFKEFEEMVIDSKDERKGIKRGQMCWTKTL
jgi:hypothetical protein